MRNKIENFIIKQTDYKHPNYIFISIVLFAIIILLGIVCNIKINN